MLTGNEPASQLTIRQYFAATAMAAYMSAHSHDKRETHHPGLAAVTGTICADELIERLNRNEEIDLKNQSIL